MVEQCPCCGSTSVTNKRERVQSNGIRMGGGRCDACRFTWTTVNGQLSKTSRHTVEVHRRNDRYDRQLAVPQHEWKW